MESVANDLLSALRVADRLREIDEVAASKRPAPGKWSKKEILGHLIDSAANNHQRFVRLQLSSRIDLPGYDGDEWVRVQAYQDRPWREIIGLWEVYNTQLAWLIRQVNPEALRHIWHMPDGMWTWNSSCEITSFTSGIMWIRPFKKFSDAGTSDPELR